MNNLLSQKWCLCLNVQNRIKLCYAKNHKFGDETTVYKYNIVQETCSRIFGLFPGAEKWPGGANSNQL